MEWNGMERNGPVQKHSQNALPVRNLFELQFSKFLFLTFQFNFLWGVANSVQFQLMSLKADNYSKLWLMLMDDSNLTELLLSKAYKGLTTSLHP